MNPNQDIIDIIRLNKLEEMNQESTQAEEDREINAKLINRKRRDLIHKVGLQLTPEQVEESKKQEKAFFIEALKEDPRESKAIEG